jgi:hypothetical protein
VHVQISDSAVKFCVGTGFGAGIVYFIMNKAGGETPAIALNGANNAKVRPNPAT